MLQYDIVNSLYVRDIQEASAQTDKKRENKEDEIKR